MQNQYSIDQWNRENEYNLPVNQMQRLKDAGINPNLYYAQGQGYNVAAQSPQLTAGAPSQVAPGMQLDMAQAIAQLGLLKAQIDNTNANTENQKSQARNNDAKTDTENENRPGLVRKTNVEADLGAANTAVAKKTLDQIDTQMAYIKSQIVNTDANTLLTNLNSDAFNTRLQHELDNLDSQTKKNFSDMGVNAAKIKEIYSMISLNDANAENIRSVTLLNGIEW